MEATLSHMAPCLQKKEVEKRQPVGGVRWAVECVSLQSEEDGGAVNLGARVSKDTNEGRERDSLKTLV